MPIRTRSARARLSIVGLAATASVLLAGVPAMAATYISNGNLAVSCDGNTIKVGPVIDHYLTNGDPTSTAIKVKQLSGTTNGSATNVFLRSENGNDLPAIGIATGQTALWTNVRAAKYTLRAYRTLPGNCNGILPGAGNYNFNYYLSAGTWP